MPTLLSRLLRDPLLISARYRIHQHWRLMLGWSLLVWALTAAVLVPFFSGVVSWHLGRSGSLVIGNEELARWLLTPLGLLYGLLTASIALLNWVLRYAGFWVIITDDLEGQRPTFAGTAARLIRQVPTLVRFCAKTVALTAALVAPVGVGLGLIYFALLRSHDINYYVSVRPAEWYLALIAAFVWLAISLGGALYLFARVILALPSWIDGYRGFLTALSRSWSLTRNRAGRLVRLLVLIATVWLSVRLAADVTMLALAAGTLGWIENLNTGVWPLLAGSGLFLGASLLLDIAIDFCGYALLATVITKFYYEDTPLHREAPAHAPAASRPLRASLHRWLRPGRAVALTAAVVGGSALLGYGLLTRLPELGPVVITAHRGGPPPWPENTLAALEGAILAGADVAEIDVLRTRDGVVVVAHDADLMRVAGSAQRIAASSYAELRGVVKTGPAAIAPSERGLATLAEFLARARGRIRLNIELKYYGWDAGLAEAVVREIRQQEMEPEVMLMSLHTEALRQLARLAPELTTGYVSAMAVGELSRLPVNFLAVPRRQATSALLRQARARGQAVHVWTVNDAGDMVDLMELGIDGIITDDPALAVRVRDELAALAPPQRLLLRFRQLLLAPLADAMAEPPAIDPPRPTS